MRQYQEEVSTESFLSWRHFFLFIAGAIVIGFVSIICWFGSTQARKALFDFIEFSPYSLLVLTPLGFAIIVAVNNRICLAALGSGVPQTIAAIDIASREGREKLLSLRIALMKIVLTFSGQAFGASTGREGPMVQIGASVMHVFSKFVPSANAVIQHRLDSFMITAGAATGVAATFNTPITGLVFVIEQVCKPKSFRIYGALLLAIVISMLTVTVIGSEHSYFSYDGPLIFSFKQWLPVVACALASGILGGVFSLGILNSRKLFPQAFIDWKAKHSIWLAGICGAIVAIIGFLSGNIVHGNGSAETNILLHNPDSLGGYFAISKFFATFFSCFSSIPGGLFAPSLGVGAGIGANFAALMPYGQPEVLIMVGITAYFSGLFKAPLTAVILVIEISGNHALAIPLIVAALIAAQVSRLICPESIYETIAEKWKKTV